LLAACDLLKNSITLFNSLINADTLGILEKSAAIRLIASHIYYMCLINSYAHKKFSMCSRAHCAHCAHALTFTR